MFASSGGLSFAAIVLLKALICALLVAAAVIDAHERRFPNPLALVLAVSCSCYTLLVRGIEDGAFSIFVALLVTLALFGSELLWRARGGVPGLGMGDIKAMFSLFCLDFLLGCVAFAGGMLLLALVGLAFKRDSLPALPFICSLGLALLLVMPL